MVYLAITAASSFAVSLAIAVAAGAWLTDRIAIVGSFIGLLPSKNPGVAFGMDLGSYQTLWILIALAIVTYIAVKTAKTFPEQIGFGLIIGGGLANIVDRTIDGHVNDMIQIGTFPIFNIADICINIGIAILFIEGFFHWKRTRKEEEKA